MREAESATPLLLTDRVDTPSTRLQTRWLAEKARPLQRLGPEQHEDHPASGGGAWIGAPILLVLALVAGAAAIAVLRSEHRGIEGAFQRLLICKQWDGPPDPTRASMCKSGASD
jgi:hypothetical protein